MTRMALTKISGNRTMGNGPVRLDLGAHTVRGLEGDTTDRFDRVSSDRAASDVDVSRPQIIRVSDPQSVSQNGKRKLLIVSTWGISCGIASFTESLVSYLKDTFDCSIFVLDPMLYRATDKLAFRAAEGQLAMLSEIAPQYDAVSLQWEPGTIGPTPTVSRRRLKVILDHCPHLICTVHSTIAIEGLRFVVRGAVVGLLRARRDGVRQLLYWFNRDSGRSYAALAQYARRPGRCLTLAVHTQRERDFFTKSLGFEKVYDHPLSMVTREWKETIEQEAAAERDRLAARFPGKKLLGVFGFLSPYKGIETAIQAMKFLPDEWHLLIYGSVHPSTIAPHAPVSPYLASLLRLLETKPHRLHRRVTFMGSVDDHKFLCSMRACDVVAFPYLEVGQSASGPASQAIELQAPTLLSYNHAFIELRKYFPAHFEFFDIGNYIHLANLVRSGDIPSAPPGYNGATQAAHYRAMILENLGLGTYVPPVQDGGAYAEELDGASQGSWPSRTQT